MAQGECQRLEQCVLPQRDRSSDLETYTITGLTNGTEYSVRVSARNMIGSGKWSPEAFWTPIELLVSEETLNVALSAFGRVVATGAVDVIGERVEGFSERRTRAVLGGVSLTENISEGIALRLTGGIPVGSYTLMEKYDEYIWFVGNFLVPRKSLLHLQVVSLSLLLIMVVGGVYGG